MFIRVANSVDLNGLGAAWKESVSDKEGGAGVADVEAVPPAADGRPLKPVLQYLHHQASDISDGFYMLPSFRVHLHFVVFVEVFKGYKMKKEEGKGGDRSEGPSSTL